MQFFIFMEENSNLERGEGLLLFFEEVSAVPLMFFIIKLSN